MIKALTAMADRHCLITTRFFSQTNITVKYSCNVKRKKNNITIIILINI